MRVVVDNTVLSNLANVHRSDLLWRLFGVDVITTEAVLAELRAGERLHRIPICDWEWLKAVRLTVQERSLADQSSRTVDRGEAECLAVASIREWMFLTDDRDARRLAQLMGVAISGTLGVLQALVDDGHLDLTAADELLAKMITAGYHSPVQSLSELER